MGILKKGYCLALPRLSGINVNGCTYEHGISPGFLVNLGFLILESCLLLFAHFVASIWPLNTSWCASLLEINLGPPDWNLLLIYMLCARKFSMLAAVQLISQWRSRHPPLSLACLIVSAWNTKAFPFYFLLNIMILNCWRKIRNDPTVSGDGLVELRDIIYFSYLFYIWSWTPAGQYTADKVLLCYLGLTWDMTDSFIVWGYLLII